VGLSKNTMMEMVRRNTGEHWRLLSGGSGFLNPRDRPSALLREPYPETGNHLPRQKPQKKI